MYDTVTGCGRDSARANSSLRLAYAVRLLALPDYDIPRVLTPDGTVQAGEVLFVAVRENRSEHNTAARAYADQHGLDMVLIDGARANVTLALGLHFYGRRAWRYARTLWRPSDAGAAVFVPLDPEVDECHAVVNGRLTCTDQAPWRDAIDCERGLDAARLGLRRLVEGR